MNNNSYNCQTGSSQPACVRCNRPLHPDEIGLTRKLINRGTSDFMCLSCLSLRFNIPERILRAKISEFRDMGCTLFVPVNHESKR